MTTGPTGALEGRVAIVTGATRGIGKGIGVGLGEAGATVYVTGRTADRSDIAALVTAAGGRGIAVRCDHSRDEDIASLFAVVERDHGRLDLLVNNATTLPDIDQLFNDRPFWEVDPRLWDDLFSVGVRSHFIASRHAARAMIPRKRGLIVNVSSRGAQKKIGVLPYGVAKSALDRMTADMAVDLKPYGITALSLWPPPTATERMLAYKDKTVDASTWSLPLFNGRVIAALAAQPDLSDRAGGAFPVRDLAAELGVDDLHPAR